MKFLNPQPFLSHGSRPSRPDLGHLCLVPMQLKKKSVKCKPRVSQKHLQLLELAAEIQTPRTLAQALHSSLCCKCETQEGQALKHCAKTSMVTVIMCLLHMLYGRSCDSLPTPVYCTLAVLLSCVLNGCTRPTLCVGTHTGTR